MLEILFWCDIMRKLIQRRVEIVTNPVHGVEIVTNPVHGVLREKLTVRQLVKNFLLFYYGTRRFMTVFTRVCHLSLS